MKRDIKKILGSADAEKIAEDYKAVDTKTSRRMFSNYLKKVGTANNQISETTDNSEIYKVEKANNTNIVRRISDVFSDRRYINRLDTSDKRWLDDDIEIVTETILDYLKSL